MSLNQIEAFLEMMQAERGASANTITAYQHDLTEFLKYLEQMHISLLALNEKQLKDYLTFLCQQKASPKTQSRHLSAIREFYRFAYSENWINQRLKSIEIRKDLTDEWKKHGLKEGVQFATLTDIIYKTWAGKTAKEYKEYKGLKKENLRDNMTNQELVLNMLAEMATTDISKARNPQNFSEHADTARRGGTIAKEAREKLELETGKKIVSPLNAKDYFELQQIEEDDKTE